MKTLPESLVGAELKSADEQPAFAEQQRSVRNLWVFFAVLAVTLISAVAIHRSLDHSTGFHWDEAIYINEASVDSQRLRCGMLLKLAGRILVKSWGRPPAYRILAVPFLAIFGFHTTIARIVTLACFGFSALFIYLGTRRVATATAGAFAALIFCLSPQVVSASSWFSTEGPLYLAISAMMYFLFVCWTSASEHSRTWVGLGLAIGLGFLAKASFFAIALPVVAFWAVLDRWGNDAIPRMKSQYKARLLALLVAGPWWLINLRAAINTSEQARGFVRNSLGRPSLSTWMRWFGTVIQSLLGYGLTIVIVLVVVAFLRRRILSGRLPLNDIQKATVGVCICAALPIMLVQLSGTNHLLRHITPAVIPLAILVGVLSQQAGWFCSKAAIIVSTLLFASQLAMLLGPAFLPHQSSITVVSPNGSLPWQIMVRSDQWDWSQLRDIADSCGTTSPRVSYLGGGEALNIPQLEYPWVAREASSRRAVLYFPEVNWLWRYEDGTLDWEKVLNSASTSDLVVTAPNYQGGVGKYDVDNKYNSEFAARLSRDPHFNGPILLKMGRFEPIEVQVFVSRSLTCHLRADVGNTRM